MEKRNPNPPILMVAILWVLVSAGCTLGTLATPVVPSEPTLVVASATLVPLTILPPTATVAPTIAPQPLLGVLQVSFTQDGNLYHWDGTAAPKQLTDQGDASQVWIAPDGIHTIFTTSQDAQFESLHVLRTDGSQPPHSILPLKDLISGDIEGITDARVLDGAWTPSSQGFIFTTLVGYDDWYSSSGSLYRFDLASGEVRSLLTDQAVESFALSPDGRKIAIGTSESVFLYFLEDGAKRPLYTFEQRITYSESPFVPQPVWGSESGYIYFMLAPLDFFQDATAEFFRISVDGSFGGVLATAETGAPLMTRTAYAPVGYLVAYTRQVDGGSNQEVHVLGQTDNVNVVYTVADVRDIQWCPNSGRLAFQDGNKGYTLIDYDGSLLGLPDESMTRLRWVDNERYLYVSQPESGPHLILASPDGTSVPVALPGSPGSEIHFDFTFGE